MSETTRLWLVMMVVIAWMVGLWAAEHAGSITESRWVAAGAGAALGLCLGFALRFGRKQDHGDAWLHRSDLLGILSKAAALVTGLAFASYAIYKIANAGPNELGHMDYEDPVTGGWLIGILIFAIWSYANTRKSDVAQ